MKIIFIISLIFFTPKINAQDSIKNTSSKDTLNKFFEEDYDKTFTKTEIEAEYPGGDVAWMRFLTKNLRYPNEAISDEIQAVVYIQFIVDKDGKVSDIIAVSGPTNGGLRQEGIRLIKLSGKWMPAMQNGRQVKAYKKVPFTFKLSKG